MRSRLTLQRNRRTAKYKQICRFYELAISMLIPNFQSSCNSRRVCPFLSEINAATQAGWAGCFWRRNLYICTRISRLTVTCLTKNMFLQVLKQLCFRCPDEIVARCYRSQRSRGCRGTVARINLHVAIAILSL